MAYNAKATKWSRNLSEESQSESNRLRLIERQKQILESKRQRQQQITPTAGARQPSATSRPVTSASLSRSSDPLIDLDEATGESGGLVNPSHSPGEEPTSPGNEKSRSPISITSPKGQSQPFISDTSQVSPLTSSPDDTPVQTPGRGPEDMDKMYIHKSSGQAKPSPLKARPPTASARDEAPPELNPLTSILDNNELFVFATQPISPQKTFQCTIMRDKRGIDRSLYPTYYMHLQAIVSSDGEISTPQNSNTLLEPNAMTRKDVEDEDKSAPGEGSKGSPKGFSFGRLSLTGRRPSASNGHRQVFVLSGRRRKKSKTYLIGSDPFDISRDNCVAKLKSNVLGTQFNAIRMNSEGQRYETTTIIYEANVLGFKGPRKMTILIPKPDEAVPFYPNISLFDGWKRNKGIVQLKNKTPVWNEDSQSYVLNFHGRVTQASVKNFQLVQCKQREEIATVNHSEPTFLGGLSPPASSTPNTPPKASYAPTMPAAVPLPLAALAPNALNLPLDEEVTMQFGRVSDKEFTCDVTWPLSLLQAFAIALSSFDSKLACE